MSQGEIVDKVVTYVVSEIVDDTDAVEVNVVSDGDDAVVAEVRAAKSDMGRVIGKRGRVARAIRNVAGAAGDEEGLSVDVEQFDPYDLTGSRSHPRRVRAQSARDPRGCCHSRNAPGRRGSVRRRCDASHQRG